MKKADVQQLTGDAEAADQIWTNPTERYPIIHDSTTNTTYVGDYGKHHTHMYEIMGYNPDTRWDPPKGHHMGVYPAHGTGNVEWWGDPPNRWEVEAELRHKMGWPEPQQEDFRLTNRRTAGNKLKWLMERPDKRLQTPEGASFLSTLAGHVARDEKIDALTPWLAREWKKGRLTHTPDAQTPLSYQPLHPDPGRIGLEPGKLSHWADWFHSNHPTRRGKDIMQMQMAQMHDQANEWDEALKQEAQQRQDVEDEDQRNGGRVLHRFPDDWTVRQLGPNQLKWEGDRMASDDGYPICVGDRAYQENVRNGITHILSLRDEKGYPHVTAELAPQDVEGGIEHSAIQQIQGKGNQVAKPEYQQRMKEFFQSFPEDERPYWQGEEPDDISELYTHEDNQGDTHPEMGGYGPHGDYGVEVVQPISDYSYLLDHDNIFDQHGYQGSHWNRDTEANVDALYKHALENGKIPEFAKAVDNFQNKAMDDYQDWRDNNIDYFNIPYPGETPVEGTDEMLHEYDSDDPDWFDSWQDHKEAYDNQEQEAADQHPGTQASSYMYELLAPHWHGDSPEQRDQSTLNQPDVDLSGYYNNFAKRPEPRSAGWDQFVKWNGVDAAKDPSWKPSYGQMYDIEPQDPQLAPIPAKVTALASNLDQWEFS